jgi:uracil-DNA glycosylase family 4
VAARRARAGRVAFVTTPRDLAQHLRYYQEIGVEGLSRDAAWRKRAAAISKDGVALPPAAPSQPDRPIIPLTDVGAADRLVAIRAEIGDCTRCKLHTGRTNLVFGVGNPEATLMFIGEGPGADEDEQGEPFVGRAGQLLTQIIRAMGFAREEVYIANVVKCRPPGNRNPEADEIAQCSPFLQAQIASIKPKVIVALGKFAAQTLLATETPISRLRGRFHEMGDTVVMPTFHPSYLLRNPAAKREVWEDMKMVMARLNE